MYLVCKQCESDDIEITSPYDNFPFYCNKCNKFLGYENVIQYQAIATHYSNHAYKSLLVMKKEVSL